MIRHNASAHENTYVMKTLMATGVAVALLCGLTSLASAQNRTSAASPRSATTAGITGQGMSMRASRSPTQAPVGHFQPSPRELPGLAHEDISRTQEQMDADKNLRICRGC